MYTEREACKPIKNLYAYSILVSLGEVLVGGKPVGDTV